MQCQPESVKVKFHAICQYKKRVLRWTKENLTDQQIIERLKRVVSNGQRVKRLPGNNVWEYVYQGIYLVVAHRSEKVVITCLGDKAYRGWYRAKKKRAA